MANSVEALSRHEIRRRLSELYEATRHLRRDIPVDNPHCATLTIADLALWCRVRPKDLMCFRLSVPASNCIARCSTADGCVQLSVCVRLGPFMQARLSEFFRGWDEGRYIKARVGDEWRIVATGEASLAQMATATRAQTAARQPFKLAVDFENTRLSIKNGPGRN